MIPGLEDGKDLGRAPGSDNALERTVASSVWELPRVDEHVGLADREHPVGALGQGYVAIATARQSHTRDPLRPWGHADFPAAGTAAHSGAEHSGAVSHEDVQRAGGRVDRIVPGSFAAAVVLAQLLVCRARPRINESDHHAAAVQALPPGRGCTDGVQRP